MRIAVAGFLPVGLAVFGAQDSIAGFDKCIRVSLGTSGEMAEFWRVWDLMASRKMPM